MVEIFSSETIFHPLTLFRGVVTRFNKIIRTFATWKLRDCSRSAKSKRACLALA